MAGKNPKFFDNPDELADFVLERMGMDINVGMVLGLGKPNHIANSLSTCTTKPIT